MSLTEFLKRHGKQIQGKQVVFYCSVGYRSPEFLERVEAAALAKGARSLANLGGGIFRWYNEGLTVYDDQGPMDNIHPFDEDWSKLIKPRLPK